MLAVWHEPVRPLPPERGTDLGWLGEVERQRCLSFGSDRRREEFLAGRDLLRRMLHALGLTGATQPLSIAIDGAPRVSSLPAVWLSLSHRRGWVAAAVADAPVGIDIECESPRDVAAFAERFCTAGERRELALLPRDAALARLHLLWALKEAAYKAAFPAQQGHALSALEAVAMPPGAGTARTWRWPDGRVLAVVGAGLDGGSFRGLEGAEGPSCWHLAPAEPV